MEELIAGGDTSLTRKLKSYNRSIKRAIRTQNELEQDVKDLDNPDINKPDMRVLMRVLLEKKRAAANRAARKAWRKSGTLPNCQCADGTVEHPTRPCPMGFR